MTTAYAVWMAERAALEQALKALDAKRPGCNTCEHYAPGKGCTVFGAQPPEEFRRGPVDCEHYVWDAIPF